MKIKTEVDETFSACGSWPANLIADIQTVRIKMGKRGFVGTPLFMIGNLSVMSAFSRIMGNSDTSYGQFLGRNKLIEDFHAIRFNEIDLKDNSALFYTYAFNLGDYPEIELGMYVIELTNITVVT